MAVLLGGPSFPSPPQAWLWLTSATACCCHKPPEASSFREKHLVQSLPSRVFSPPVHLLAHTETTSASPFINLPPVAVSQRKVGSVQLGPGPHTGLSLELGPAIECQGAVSAGRSRCRGSCSLEAMQEPFRLTLTSTPGPWLVVRVDSGPWKVAGHRTARLQFHGQREGSSRATSEERGHSCAAGARQFLPQWPACPSTRAAQSVTRAEGGLARARQTELTHSLLERAKNSCRQWSKRSVCGGVRAGWWKDELSSALVGGNGAADGAVRCHG